MNSLLEFEEEINENKASETKTQEVCTSSPDDLLSDFVLSAAQPNANFYLPSQLLSLNSNSPNSSSEAFKSNGLGVYNFII